MGRHLESLMPVRQRWEGVRPPRLPMLYRL
jgi:hypothetical protein